MIEPLFLLPVLDPEEGISCLHTMAPLVRRATCVVWNNDEPTDPYLIGPLGEVETLIENGENIGVAAAWNRGVDELDADLGLTHLVLVSERIRFGEPGGTDFWRALDATDPDGEGWGCLGGLEYGWHLFAISRRMLDAVGRFDEAFFAFYEDSDWLWRAGLVGAPSPRENGRTWEYVEVDGHPGEFGTNVGAPGVDYGAARARYVAKWGGDQGHERYRVPFG